MARENDMRDCDGTRRRLFVDADLGGGRVELGEREAHYVGRVLRLRRGDPLVVFNGRGGERSGRIEHLERRRAAIALEVELQPLAEPPTSLTLIQALVKSDAMDTIVQKATELGVSTIRVVRTDFSVVKLDADRAVRRLEHWSRVARSACEQSGRHRPPEIHAPGRLADVLETLPEQGPRIVFHPDAPALEGCATAPEQHVCVLLGPEGGFSDADLETIDAAGFARFCLGPRILRADTAAIAACTLTQRLWGDLG